MGAVPVALSDALSVLQDKKDSAEKASVAKTVTAADLVTAQKDDEQALAALNKASDDLNKQRQVVEAIEDAYYTLGGTSPDAPPSGP